MRNEQTITWGERWRAAARAAGLPVEHAARSLDIPTSTLRAWIDGRHRAPADDYVRLCRLVGLDPAELMEADHGA